MRNVQAVTQESIYTFFQTLTESVKRSHNVTLVATLPEGKQAGGQGGMTVLDELEEILKRVDAVSIPLEVDNAFKVVRGRIIGLVQRCGDFFALKKKEGFLLILMLNSKHIMRLNLANRCILLS